MLEIDKSDRKRLSKLFQDYQWNYLPDSILDGYMGRALVDDEHNPQVAVLEIPHMKLFLLGGDAKHPTARLILEGLSVPAVLIFASPGWLELVQEIHASKLISMPRYAFISENLDIKHLRELSSQLPNGYRLERMDLNLAEQLTREKSEFTSGHLLNFASPQDFLDRGFGFCILDGDEIVSAATTFAICDRGIEVQVSTREKHRGKGLATVVAASLLIHSLQNHLDPNWDAENVISAGLAKKLGYTPQGNYSMWIVVGSRRKAVLWKAALRIKEFCKR